MDLSFNCPNCNQEMVVDSSGAGSEVECPACNAKFQIPEPDITNLHPLNPIATSAAARESKHYVVPMHEEPSEILIKKPNVPLEVAAKVTDKTLRIKCFRRTDCMELNHDRFEEVVSNFLSKIGDENVVSINTLNYNHMDMATRTLMTDYGVMIVYKG